MSLKTVIPLLFQRLLFRHWPQVYEDASKVYLVTELLRGGELLDRILAQKRLSEREAADVMAVLVDTVAYLHRNGVRSVRAFF